MSEPLPFPELQDFFTNTEEHGQLCDIVVPNANVDAWTAFLSRVVPLYEYRFCLLNAQGSSQAPIPSDIGAMFVQAETTAGPWPSLGLQALDLLVRVHFYSADWIELDVWRADITPENYLALSELMQRMGDAMGRDVFMTAEANASFAEVVYEVALRRFRRPRHGSSAADRSARVRVLTALQHILAPFCGPGARGCTVETLQVALDQVRAMSAEVGELSLQDSLEPADRGTLYSVSSILMTTLNRPMGSLGDVDVPGCVQRLAKFGHRCNP